ncbi:MAG: hypothetical protein LBL26_09325 [Peptococcaceae bacterium]|jgi:hypothetical protein|nr:hypothetical protein [Peptococcaceae bacterium]
MPDFGLWVFLDVFREWIYWLMVLVTGAVYYRITLDPAEAGSLTFFSWIAGAVGGLAGSLLLILSGVAIQQSTCLWLLGITFALGLFRRRFMCFAYAGGLLSAVSLLLGTPRLEAPQIMGLAAVLHLVEALLIGLMGAYRPMAACRRNGRGEWLPALSLRKIWPVPLMMLAAGYIAPRGGVAGVMDMPAWWPLIPQEAGTEMAAAGGEWVYVMFPAAVALGYGDVAPGGNGLRPAGRLLRPRIRKNCLQMAGYGVVLLLLCVWAGHVPALVWLPVLFGPVAHDALFWYNAHKDRS